MRHFSLVVLATLSVLSFSELDTLNELQKQATDLAAGASNAAQDLEAADYLMGKFRFGKDGSLMWYPEIYPRSGDMVPGSGVRPRLKLFKPLVDNKPLLAPILEIYRKKNSSGSCEVPLNPPVPRFSSVLEDPFCMEKAKQYDVDESTLASIQKLTNVSDDKAVQSAFVSVLNLDALSEDQRTKIMSNPEVSIKAILDSLGSDSQKQALFNSRKLQFLEYIADPDNVSKLKYIRTLVGGMSVDIPVAPPRGADPANENLACEIELVSQEPIPLNLETNEVEVKFHIKANSVVSAADVSLDNGNEGRLEEEDFLPYETSNFGKLVRVSKNEVILKLSKADLQDARIHRVQDKYQSNVNHQVWTVTGKAQGVDQSMAPAECTKDILVDFPLAPKCIFANISPSDTKVHQGKNIQFDLDCSLGGPVKKVDIGADVNNRVVRTQTRSVEDSLLLPDEQRIYRNFNYSRITERDGERIKATTLGLRGQSSDIYQTIAGICPWTNPSFGGSVAVGGFSLSRKNKAWETATELKLYSQTTIGKNTHYYGAKIGDLRLSNCGKTVATYYWARTGGCFTPDTQIKMANGSLKQASDIHENDYIFNPHYNTGIRVRKVVKGPEKKSLFEVRTNEGKVEVTEDHPFLTGRGWLQAMVLKKGDKLLGNGKPSVVSSVKKLKYQGPEDVWNFELDTEDPMAHVVIANGIPTGDLVTQLELKKSKAKLP